MRIRCAKPTKVRKLPNYSIKRVESVKRAILKRAERIQTCAVCSQKSKRPRDLYLCPNSSFRSGGTSSPRQRNAPVAFFTRLNESFDRHLLLEGRAVEPYEWMKVTSTYFNCWFRAPSLIRGFFPNVVHVVSHVNYRKSYILKILINF